MAKTYTAAGSATAGDVYTANAHNVIVTDVNNLIVPASVQVKRTTNLTGYTNATLITWEAEDWDTDGMWSSGSSVTIQTAGLYVITLYIRMTTATAPTFVDWVIGGSVNARSNSSLGRANDYRGTVTAVRSLSVNDTVNAYAEFSGGTTHVIDGTVLTTLMNVTWIGRTS